MLDLSNFGNKYYEKLWRSMNWENIYRHLAHLQKELSIAANEQNYTKVTTLQKAITEETDIRALAVHKVIDEHSVGAGIDGVMWITDAQKMMGAMSLNAEDYKSQPFRRIIIQDKKNMKERHIGVPTVKDRAMQTLYSFALDPVSEATADKKSFAFRKGRSGLDVHYYICEALKYPNSPEWVLKGDIKSCYESISHEWLLRNIPMNTHVLYEFLKSGFVFGHSLFPTEQGISLGMSISPIIANMTLDGLQKVIFDLQPKYEQLDYANGNLVRYADDIIVTARTEESAQLIKSKIQKFLALRGLKLSEKKTKIIHISDGFDFLSRNYCKRDGLFCATPSEKAVKNFENNLKTYILESGKQRSQRSLIKGINARLQGWSGYHRVEQSEETFRHFDVLVATLLLKLMLTLYPKKSKKHIIDTYWYTEADGTKTFALPHRKDIRVVRMRDILLTEHKPIVLRANPYTEPEYFETRLDIQDINKANGQYKSIWRRQKGKCYYCGEQITESQPRELVHRNSPDDADVSNLAYIHTACKHDEAFFIQTDIENPDNIDIFKLAKEITETERNNNNPQKVMIENLKKYFKNCDKRKLTMKFSEIENILGVPLVKEAYKYDSFWYKKKADDLPSAWQSQGFEVTNVDFCSKEVNFHKTVKKSSKLMIPKIFLTDKIPNDAKYELERFFDYIRKKYGI